jgi:hypothetical protein
MPRDSLSNETSKNPIASSSAARTHAHIRQVGAALSVEAGVRMLEAAIHGLAANL